MENSKSLKCDRCEVTSKEGSFFELPGFVFNFLEGQPFICERCIANFLGIEREWLDVVKIDLKISEMRND